MHKLLLAIALCSLAPLTSAKESSEAAALTQEEKRAIRELEEAMIEKKRLYDSLDPAKDFDAKMEAGSAYLKLMAAQNQLMQKALERSGNPAGKEALKSHKTAALTQEEKRAIRELEEAMIEKKRLYDSINPAEGYEGKMAAGSAYRKLSAAQDEIVRKALERSQR